jgi:hypothetical protein
MWSSDWCSRVIASASDSARMALFEPSLACRTLSNIGHLLKLFALLRVKGQKKSVRDKRGDYRDSNDGRHEARILTTVNNPVRQAEQGCDRPKRQPRRH